ncbi:uncharacterized protein N7469_000161 [Penicillium citrinum]|uniref:AttH domain-containing protein n=2 Tax=Penicillium TaxID=5073 RepID=A0A9W9PC76_PENCI|nr:uncharacterized protein N7469_000161 [Penicillium citrinum]KAJ5241834.1 hypothetical protein N7469_000161 [Penicillium citrinum]KAJ5600671.1 hypothetical protein N7450_001738 [Penicillium hetheringtonii]KAK5807442.1 hypothetical protein VI817_001700 [Penicillium citrinum]
MTKILAGAAIVLAVAFGSFFSQSSTVTPPAPRYLPNDWDSTCTISKSGAYEVYSGDNSFSTSSADHLSALKIHPNINSTNWEQWEFDGSSQTGLSSVLLVFSRDPSYSFFGQGNLRIEFYIALPDGKRVEVLDYLEESTVVHCPGRYTAGMWNSTDRSYSFRIDDNMKNAQLSFDSAKIHGKFNVTSDTSSALADGTLWTGKDDRKGVSELSPGLFYAVPIPGGFVQMDATLESGKRLVFKGKGGSTRLWAKAGWLNLCGGWKNIRGWAGPYTVVYWELISRINKGVKYTTGLLFRDGELLVGTRNGNISQTEDYTVFEDLYGGEVKGSFADQSTGHNLKFVSPDQEKEWSFDIEHMHSFVEFRAPGEDEYGNKGLGQSGFTNRVSGGEVGEDRAYEGRGITEKCRWPKEFGKLALAIASGAGFFGPKFQMIFIKVVSYLV